MLTIHQQNIVSVALAHALARNNSIDCDTIASAITDLCEATTPKTAFNRLNFLSSAINHRSVDRQSVKFCNDFLATL